MPCSCTSVPAYLEYTTLSPVCGAGGGGGLGWRLQGGDERRARRRTLTALAPPTETTSPWVGFLAALVGSRMPPTVFCSGSSTLTNTRSPTGATVFTCMRAVGVSTSPRSAGACIAALGRNIAHLCGQGGGRPHNQAAARPHGGHPRRGGPAGDGAAVHRGGHVCWLGGGGEEVEVQAGAMRNAQGSLPSAAGRGCPARTALLQPEPRLARPCASPSCTHPRSCSLGSAAQGPRPRLRPRWSTRQRCARDRARRERLACAP